MKKTEEFCRSLLGTKIGKIKALCNLIFALSSNIDVRSVTALSENKHYFYQYSSINDAIHGLYSRYFPADLVDMSAKELKLEKKLLRLILNMLHPNSSGFVLLNTDITGIYRPYSHTLPNNGVIYNSANGRLRGTKPIDLGIAYSCVAYSSSVDLSSHEDIWNVPLSIRQVTKSDNKNSFTAQQVKEVLVNLETEDLVVNCLDSAYCSPEYIANTSDRSNLVSIIRIAKHRNVWTSVTSEAQAVIRASNPSNKGANRTYGDTCKLSDVDNWDITATDTTRFDYTTAKGEKLEVEAQVWENMKLRSKRGINMKALSCRLVCIRLYEKNATEQNTKSQNINIHFG